ncbi:hypothetical protein [Nocardia sp. R6R-6]|uniref:hypothetical protein n=1 Tax=Nocardia sp. R6R-6 TaxID=3459303 RepID=UPI00403DC36C
MTEQPDLKQEFRFLAGEASAGRLLIEDDVAERLAKICDDYVNSLNSLSKSADRVVAVDSFGILASAKTLAKKFQDLAVGGVGSGSYQDSVRQHIDVVRQMADMFRKAGEAYKAVDRGTQQAIAKAGDQV